jgi:hypothetical protein
MKTEADLVAETLFSGYLQFRTVDGATSHAGSSPHSEMLWSTDRHRSLTALHRASRNRLRFACGRPSTGFKWKPTIDTFTDVAVACAVVGDRDSRPVWSPRTEVTRRTV